MVQVQRCANLVSHPRVSKRRVGGSDGEWYEDGDGWEGGRKSSSSRQQWKVGRLDFVSSAQGVAQRGIKREWKGITVQCYRACKAISLPLISRQSPCRKEVWSNRGLYPCSKVYPCNLDMYFRTCSTGVHPFAGCHLSNRSSLSSIVSEHFRRPLKDDRYHEDWLNFQLGMGPQYSSAFCIVHSVEEKASSVCRLLATVRSKRFALCIHKSPVIEEKQNTVCLFLSHLFATYLRSRYDPHRNVEAHRYDIGLDSGAYSIVISAARPFCHPRTGRYIDWLFFKYLSSFPAHWPE